MFQFLVILFICIIPSLSYGIQKTKVFILSGQSNCAGGGNGELLEEKYKINDPGIQQFTQIQGTRAWRPLAPYPRIAEKFGIDKLAFGPELVFGRELRSHYPKQQFAIIKQAKGGTSVVAWDKDYKSEDWLKNMILAGHDPEGKRKRDPLYPVLLNTVKEGLSQLKDPYEICGFLWFQNERDSHHIKTAVEWSKRVIELAHHLFEDIGASKDLPVYIMEPHYFSKRIETPYTEQLMEQIKILTHESTETTAERLQSAMGLSNISQEEFKELYMKAVGRNLSSLTQFHITGQMRSKLIETLEQRPKTFMIEVDDLPTYEGIHFTSEGQTRIGKRLFQAYQKTF